MRTKQKLKDALVDVEVLTRKIKGFTKGSTEVQEKKEVKSSVLTAELQRKDADLKAARFKNIEQEEEMKRLSLLKEKYAHEREHILDQLRANERELEELRATAEGQVRLI